MEPKQHLLDFIDRQGGIPAAANALSMPYQSLRSIVAGWRGVNKKRARVMAENSRGELDANVLVWIKATRKERKA